MENKVSKVSIIIYILIVIYFAFMLIDNFYLERNWGKDYDMGCMNYGALSEDDLKVAKVCGIGVSGCNETEDTKIYSKKINTLVDECYCVNNQSFYRVCLIKGIGNKLEFKMPITREELL